MLSFKLARSTTGWTRVGRALPLMRPPCELQAQHYYKVTTLLYQKRPFCEQAQLTNSILRIDELFTILDRNFVSSGNVTSGLLSTSSCHEVKKSLQELKKQLFMLDHDGYRIPLDYFLKCVDVHMGLNEHLCRSLIPSGSTLDTKRMIPSQLNAISEVILLCRRNMDLSLVPNTVAIGTATIKALSEADHAVSSWAINSSGVTAATINHSPYRTLVEYATAHLVATEHFEAIPELLRLASSVSVSSSTEFAIDPRSGSASKNIPDAANMYNVLSMALSNNTGTGHETSLPPSLAKVSFLKEVHAAAKSDADSSGSAGTNGFVFRSPVVTVTGIDALHHNLTLKLLHSLEYGGLLCAHYNNRVWETNGGGVRVSVRESDGALAAAQHISAIHRDVLNALGSYQAELSNAAPATADSDLQSALCAYLFQLFSVQSQLLRLRVRPSTSTAALSETLSHLHCDGLLSIAQPLAVPTAVDREVSEALVNLCMEHLEQQAGLPAESEGVETLSTNMGKELEKDAVSAALSHASSASDAAAANSTQTPASFWNKFRVQAIVHAGAGTAGATGTGVAVGARAAVGPAGTGACTGAGAGASLKDQYDSMLGAYLAVQSQLGATDILLEKLPQFLNTAGVRSSHELSITQWRALCTIIANITPPGDDTTAAELSPVLSVAQSMMQIFTAAGYSADPIMRKEAIHALVTACSQNIAAVSLRRPVELAFTSSITPQQQQIANTIASAGTFRANNMTNSSAVGNAILGVLGDESLPLFSAEQMNGDQNAWILTAGGAKTVQAALVAVAAQMVGQYGTPQNEVATLLRFADRLVTDFVNTLTDTTSSDLVTDRKPSKVITAETVELGFVLTGYLNLYMLAHRQADVSAAATQVPGLNVPIAGTSSASVVDLRNALCTTENLMATYLRVFSRQGEHLLSCRDLQLARFEAECLAPASTSADSRSTDSLATDTGSPQFRALVMFRHLRLLGAAHVAASNAAVATSTTTADVATGRHLPQWIIPFGATSTSFSTSMNATSPSLSTSSSRTPQLTPPAGVFSKAHYHMLCSYLASSWPTNVTQVGHLEDPLHVCNEIISNYREDIGALSEDLLCDCIQLFGKAAQMARDPSSKRMVVKEAIPFINNLTCRASDLEDVVANAGHCNSNINISHTDSNSGGVVMTEKIARSFIKICCMNGFTAEATDYARNILRIFPGLNQTSEKSAAATAMVVGCGSDSASSGGASNVSGSGSGAGSAAPTLQGLSKRMRRRAIAMGLSPENVIATATSSVSAPAAGKGKHGVAASSGSRSEPRYKPTTAAIYEPIFYSMVLHQQRKSTQLYSEFGSGAVKPSLEDEDGTPITPDSVYRQLLNDGIPITSRVVESLILYYTQNEIHSSLRSKEHRRRENHSNCSYSGSGGSIGSGSGNDGGSLRGDFQGIFHRDSEIDDDSDSLMPFDVSSRDIIDTLVSYHNQHYMPSSDSSEEVIPAAGNSLPRIPVFLALLDYYLMRKESNEVNRLLQLVYPLYNKQQKCDPYTAGSLALAAVNSGRNMNTGNLHAIAINWSEVTSDMEMALLSREAMNARLSFYGHSELL